MHLLAIDPGVDVGWALVEDSRLAACGLGHPPPCQPDEVIIECPVLRPRGEKNPNAILKLARNAGEWGGRLGGGRYVSPNEWKKNVPKDISHARIWAKLDDQEKTIVDDAFRAHKGRNGMAPSKRHNVIDAIGIALWGVGR